MVNFTIHIIGNSREGVTIQHFDYSGYKDRNLHDECELINAINSIYEKCSGDINSLIAQFKSNMKGD